MFSLATYKKSAKQNGHVKHRIMPKCVAHCQYAGNDRFIFSITLGANGEQGTLHLKQSEFSAQLKAAKALAE